MYMPWMNRLTVERLEEKTQRIQRYLSLTDGDWERVFFITLARNFGFGTNAQAFEQWAPRPSTPKPLASTATMPFELKPSSWDKPDCSTPKPLPPTASTTTLPGCKTNTPFCVTSSACSPSSAIRGSLAVCAPRIFPRRAVAACATLCRTPHRLFAPA